MKTIKHETKHNQPNVYKQLIEERDIKNRHKKTSFVDASKVDTEILRADKVRVASGDKITKKYTKQKGLLTKFFERFDEMLDPICDAIRKAMRRFEINI